MEFEKRWCMFLTTGVWLLWKYLFFYVAIGRRVPITEEYFHYALNAFILTLVFAAIEKYTNTHIGKSLLATFMSAVFVVQIILENYMLEYLRFMPYSNWEWSMEEATVSGLTRYIKYGYPGYHWAFLGMLCICFIVIIIRSFKPKIMRAIADSLFEKAMKTKKSIYFTIVFENFIKYITVIDYLILKDAYLNLELKYSIISRCFENEDFIELDRRFQPLLDSLQEELAGADIFERESSETEKEQIEQTDDNCVCSKESNEE